MKLETLFVLFLLSTGLHAQDFELEDRTIQVGEFVYEAQAGLLKVPQRYARPEQGSLMLFVVILRSESEQPEDPVFFLNGLPGAASALRDSELWAGYLKTRDVVLIDQRGCGNSQPSLTWSRAPLRAELLLGNYFEAESHALEVAKAIRLFTSLRGIDLNAFNTRESARDIESVRKALAYDEIVILGHSAGTHLGFEYLRQFPKRVTHFASLGTAGPGDIHSLPAELDASLRQVSELVARDPRIGPAMGDLFGRVEKLLERVEKDPLEVGVRHPESGEPVNVKLGAQGLRFILLLDLGDPADFIVFPRMLHELEQGRQEILGWFVQKRYAQLSEWPAILFINRAASGATSERWSSIREQAKRSPFGMTRCNFSPLLDQAFGIRDLGDDFRAPIESLLPALFISGSLDANTPPSRAENARAGFPRSVHLVLENGGHDAILQSQEVHQTIRAFLNGEALGGVRLKLPVPRFALLEGADAEVQHPSMD